MRRGGGGQVSAERLDALLSRLFTQELHPQEAEAILEELAPMAGELAPRLVTLLNSPDSRTRETASQALIFLRHPGTLDTVRALLERPGISDTGRLAAYTVLELLGEAPDADALLGALKDPAALFERSRDELLAKLARDSQACEFWESLEEIDAETRREMVQDLGERRDPRARKMLTAALWDEDAEVTLAAVESLRALGDPRAADSLLWLAEISRKPAVAEAARHAAVEIRVRSSARGEAPEPPADEPECWASFIDGDGGQLLLAARRSGVQARPPTPPNVGGASGGGVPAEPCEEWRRLAFVSLSDHRGIVDVTGTDAATGADIDELLDTGQTGCKSDPTDSTDPSDPSVSPRLRGDSGSPDIGWVRVDAAYCAAAIEAARQINRRDHRRLPGVWEFWRDTFEGGEGEAALELDDRTQPADRLRRRLAQTASLIQFQGFHSWLIQMQDLAPFLPAALRGMGRGPQEREEQIARAVTACLAGVIKTRQRRVWRRRLLRQGALWRRRGDRIVSELCLAAAWGLDDRNGVPTEEHPFLRAMTRRSMELAIGDFPFGTNGTRGSSD